MFPQFFEEGTTVDVQGLDVGSFKVGEVEFNVLGQVKIPNLHFRTFLMFISILCIVLGLDAVW